MVTLKNNKKFKQDYLSKTESSEVVSQQKVMHDHDKNAVKNNHAQAENVRHLYKEFLENL